MTAFIQQFLRCREAWLVGIIDDLDQSNSYEYLKRMADCHRVHLFDVVMQYRAIFSDDTSGHEENTDGGLLYSWAMHRISSHLHVLREVLPQITEGPNLAIILDQCMVRILKACLQFLSSLRSPSLRAEASQDLEIFLFSTVNLTEQWSGKT